MADLAVYTTVYPGVEPYLADWYRSLQRQTDQDFELWIGVDQLPVADVLRAMGGRPEARWVTAAVRDSHAEVRQRALARITPGCEAVVLVDSDDMLHPQRVAAARQALASSPVTGCALQMVDERGEDLGQRLSLPPGMAADDVLPRHNVFGLSNTAYTSAALGRCLPIPPEAVLVDWFLATRAWLLGIPLSFDQRPLMDYRQHGTNTARVLPPFTADRVTGDTALVLRHLELLRASAAPDDVPHRTAAVEEMEDDVRCFRRRIVTDPARLAAYVRALNEMEIQPIWWSSVAHPALRHLWARREGVG